MGEVAEMMLDGTLCQCCGIYLDDDETDEEPGNGYPITCKSCKQLEETPNE